MGAEKVRGLLPASWRPRIGSDGISSSSQRPGETGELRVYSQLKGRGGPMSGFRQAECRLVTSCSPAFCFTYTDSGLDDAHWCQPRYRIKHHTLRKCIG